MSSSRGGSIVEGYRLTCRRWSERASAREALKRRPQPRSLVDVQGRGDSGSNVTIQCANDVVGGVDPRRPALSDRERQVLLGWLESDSKSEAAQRLYISIGTMNTHLTRIRAKYAAVGRPATTKAALFVRALQDGITELGHW